MKIKELPVGERPYERLEICGPELLSDAELLAIIIKTGTKDKTAIEIAQEVLKYDFEGKGISFLRELSLEEIKSIKGIGRVKAIELKALGEIASRISYNRPNFKIKINCPEDIVRLVMSDMKDLKQETIKTILLDNQNQVLRVITNAVGTINSATLEAREVFKEPIKASVAKIAIVHNHPSGNVTPSSNDVSFTIKINNVGQMIGIELVDHIIIGGNGEFCSLKRKKMF